jgi:isocitrate dehydrogenase
MHYDKITVPVDGSAITVNPDGSIDVPDRPVIPFIEGDGIGIAPGFAGKDHVNPGSLILSAEMMLRWRRRTEAADRVMKGVVNTIASKELTFDLARLRKAIRAPKLRRATNLQTVKEDLEELVPGATLVGTSGFGDAVIRHMDD